MQSEITNSGDLIMTWSYSERMELADKIEAIQHRMERNFEKIFGGPLPSNGMTRREEPGQD
jgi:hypothetical protein